ncbi:MAG TPA: VOC family protein [Marinobacter sp.]
MKYMLMRKADADTENGVMPSEDIEHHAQHKLPREMNVHVAFAGNCREAMEFYAAVTAGHLEAMITYGETPAAEDVPAEMRDRIIHSSLNIRGRRLMGADMAGDCYQAPQGAQVHLDYADTEQSERVFRALAEEGTVIMPFDQTFWAHRFGMVKDRFGVQWMISADLEQCQ